MVDRTVAAAVVLHIENQHDKITYEQSLPHGPSTTSHGLMTALALPDSDSGTLDVVLTAESACISGVLGDFHLLDLLTQGSTVTRAILSDNADLLCTLGH